MEKTPPYPPDLAEHAANDGAPLSVGIEALKAYLRANPDALDEDRELVSLLTPPTFRRGHNVVDMQSFMIERLRTQAAEREARELKIRQALASDALEERRIQKAALLIVSARSFEALITAITSDLAPMLGASAVALNIERPDGASSGVELAAARTGGPIQLIPPGSVERFLGAGLDARAASVGSTEVPLFPRKKGPVRSFVVVRLTFAPSAPPGLLAVGSKASGRFTKSSNLNRYTFLARVIEQGIRLWLDLPPG
jgi:hypothetical protein